MSGVSGADAPGVADAHSGDVPNPGSDAALKAGCQCPVMDNWRGDPAMGRIRGFIVSVGCPVHHPATPGGFAAPKKEDGPTGEEEQVSGVGVRSASPLGADGLENNRRDAT